MGGHGRRCFNLCPVEHPNRSRPHRSRSHSPRISHRASNSPTSTLMVAQKVHIVIVYQNLAGDSLNRANHGAQIKYLMEAAKMLGVNPKLKELSLQLSQRSCDPHRRESIINLIWPFLLFVGSIKLTLTRRRWRPDNTWYEPSSNNVLPPDLERLFR